MEILLHDAVCPSHFRLFIYEPYLEIQAVINTIIVSTVKIAYFDGCSQLNALSVIRNCANRMREHYVETAIILAIESAFFINGSGVKFKRYSMEEIPIWRVRKIDISGNYIADIGLKTYHTGEYNEYKAAKECGILLDYSVGRYTTRRLP